MALTEKAIAEGASPVDLEIARHEDELAAIERRMEVRRREFDEFNKHDLKNLESLRQIVTALQRGRAA